LINAAVKFRFPAHKTSSLLKLTFKFFFISLILTFVSGQIFGQSKYYTEVRIDTLPVNFENKYFISSVSILPFTETIKLRDSILNRNDYEISYSDGSFALSDTLPYSIFDTLIISYETIRLSLQKEYKRRSLVIKYDEKYGDTIRVAQSETGFSAESIFGAGIEKSGTIVRGFTVGTTKDFSLQSGLRLQLSGRLSDDIEIVAALTDENTPIQPEGNTERLDELDKVFIQIKHPNAIGTFGDYQLQRSNGEFGFIDRKLQGLLGEFFVEDYNAFVSVAGSKGKFNTNSFLGQEGVQGPYSLSGINNEPDIIIIAGSEKVFVDGIEMKRGEANDYVIEYSNARITFTPGRLITSASRINVDFEYTDRRYSRNLFGAGSGGSFFDEKLSINFQYFQEGDDQDAPIDISLSDEDKEILAAAGDDRSLAVKSGVTLAQPDSLGITRGTYIRVDTLINAEPFTYYQYSPGDTNALYNVSFNFAGVGAGDYVRESLGNFRFVGRNRGGYLPVVYLPLPELKQVGNLVVDIKPFEDVSLSLEYAGSLWDRNRFSNLDDKDNYGHARNIFFRINPKNIEIGNISFGKMGLSYKDRFIQDKFTSADRFNTIEFNRNYNVGTQLRQESEQLREFNLNLIPVEELMINSSIGFLRKGESFKSNRYNNILRFSDNKNYSLDYNFDYVESENQFLKSTWVRQGGKGSYLIWKLRPGVEFLAEDKKDKPLQADTLLSGSLRYHEVIPFVELLDYEGITLSAKYSFREDFFPLHGIMFKESKSATQFYEARYQGIREISSTLNFTLRKKIYEQAFKEQGFLDTETILIRTQNRFRLWAPLTGDFFYEVSTQRSARLERVFVRVERGTGNFKYLGDLNNNGIADENEYEPTIYDGDYIAVTIPTDELFPVIDLKTSTKWKLNMGEIFDRSSLAGTLLKPFSTETFWRIEENSREEDYKKIYLLNLSSFQSEDKTIRGSNLIQQDFFIFENDQELSMRFRYLQRRSMNQFSGGLERMFHRERSIRIKFRLVREISNQTDIINEADNVASASSSNRNRMISGNSVDSDFSYRPERNIEVGFKIKVGRKVDDFPANPTIIDQNSQTIRLNLSFAGTGRLRLEVERAELLANTTSNFLPFELIGGNLLGKNYFWRLNFDYRISTNLQSTISYDGRLQGDARAVHTARAEVRAYF
jgi:hypothetical protein